MPSAQIRINKTKELTELLRVLRSMFHVLDDSEIVKLALARFYQEEMGRKWDARIASLPLMELSDEEQASLTEGIKSLEEDKINGRLHPMTADEIMEAIRTGPDA